MLVKKHLTKNKILKASVNALLLLAFVVSMSLSASVKKTLRSQQAAAAWAGQSGERFAQLSAFMPSGSVFDENSQRSLRQAIDRALVDASLEEEPGRTLYTDAWSAVGEVLAVGERGFANAQAIGVGGNFFLFHPLYLKDGSYFSPNDLMSDRIVIDEDLAWRLFGSTQLSGLEVLLGEKQFYIAGVISRESDLASTIAYTGGAGLFMSYEALLELTFGNIEMLCYEIVLPDPIAGFALKTFQDCFSVSGSHIIENSSRYSFSGIIKVISSFGERSLRRDGMIYPYWENAARYTEDWLALLLLLSIVFIIFPVVSFILFVVKTVRYVISVGKHSRQRRIEKRDLRQAENYRIEHSKAVTIPGVEEIIREVQEERGSERA